MSQLSLPVLIVGAGPTGLNLANLLVQYGISHRLIDEKIEPIHTSNALVVQARSLEMWDSMGLAEDAILRGKKILGLSLNNAVKQIGQIDFSKAGLATRFPFLLGLSQADSERLLAEHLAKQGGSVERGTTLVDFTQSETGVIAELLHATGEKETLHCDWLIATDGSHSVVRKKLNLDFEGDAIPEKFIMMDAEITADFDSDYFHAILSTEGPLVFATLPKFTRIICTVTSNSGVEDVNNPTVEDFENIIKKRSRLPVRINNPIWISHFMTQHRLINNYRHGRVLFAGDSAHVHSPVGGQGMNTGMQDTFNLAWKLALIIKGKSKTKLIDTYNDERRPIAKSVLATTTKMTEIVAIKNPYLISLRNGLMGFLLKTKMVQHAIANNISELGISYASNSIIINNGKRALDAMLIDSKQKPINLQQLFCGLKQKVLFFTGKNHSVEQINQIRQVIAWIHNNVKELCEIIIISSMVLKIDDNDLYHDKNFEAHQSYLLPSGGICVVRPDGYIGMVRTEINVDVLSAYFYSGILTG